MPDYRLFLMRDGHICAARSLIDTDEAAARETARLIFESCDDVIEGYELWHLTKKIESSVDGLPPAMPTLEDLTLKRQNAICDHEIMLWDSFLCIQSSKKLMDAISRLSFFDNPSMSGSRGGDASA